MPGDACDDHGKNVAPSVWARCVAIIAPCPSGEPILTAKVFDPHGGRVRSDGWPGRCRPTLASQS
jgi:hypothetical protein